MSQTVLISHLILLKSNHLNYIHIHLTGQYCLFSFCFYCISHREKNLRQLILLLFKKQQQQKNTHYASDDIMFHV